jgi:hypothetical protein
MQSLRKGILDMTSDDLISSSFSRDVGDDRDAALREEMRGVPDVNERMAALENTISMLCRVLVENGTISINDARRIMGIL